MSETISQKLQIRYTRKDAAVAAGFGLVALIAALWASATQLNIWRRNGFLAWPGLADSQDLVLIRIIPHRTMSFVDLAAPVSQGVEAFVVMGGIVLAIASCLKYSKLHAFKSVVAGLVAVILLAALFVAFKTSIDPRNFMIDAVKGEVFVTGRVRSPVCGIGGFNVVNDPGYKTRTEYWVDANYKAGGSIRLLNLGSRQNAVNLQNFLTQVFSGDGC